MSSELACVLASIILTDAKQEITADSISKVIKAANIKVEAQWPLLFANFLAGKNMNELLTSIGSAGAAPQVQQAAEVKAEVAKEKTEEEQIVAGFAFGNSSSSEDESS
uniref:Ribosomal protein P1B n=1 Tax=Trepomonas sp. PC1 TaxID=1076344 RepID=A0A146KJ45_9EUKA|eukprot:JAP96477.1 Ribosomal protein P1B [Trepomonas sp. PC1]